MTPEDLPDDASQGRRPQARNRLRTLLRGDAPVLNGWLTTGSTLMAEAVAQVGFDAVTLDMQHGALDWGDVLGVLQALTGHPVVPLVRVAWNDPAAVMKALDLGAWGVICPMIESAADARSFARACRYPPHGIRSHGPTRARSAWGADYTEIADAETLAIAMVETRGALDDLEEVVRTPGIDALFVGPADLGRALGVGPAGNVHAGPLRDALDRVVGVAAEARLPVAIFVRSLDDALGLSERGFRMITVGGEVDHMAAGAARVVQAFAPRRASSEERRRGG